MIHLKRKEGNVDDSSFVTEEELDAVAADLAKGETDWKKDISLIVFEALGLETEDPEHNGLVLEFIRVTLGAVSLFARKNRAYSPRNISEFSSFGVLVRLSDKMARLKNLMRSGSSPSWESVQDTWVDIGNYGFIGLLCDSGLWPGAEPGVYSDEE